MIPLLMTLASILLTMMLATTLGQPTQPTLPEGSVLLQRFIRAVGGEAAIRTITDMSANGRIHLPGVADPGHFQWAIASGGRCVFTMHFPDLGKSTFGSNGRVGWEIIQLDDETQQRELDIEIIEARRRRANWFELALTLPTRARTFTTIGRSSFDGVDAFEVRMTDAEDRPHHLFFSADSHYLLGVRLIERGPLGPVDVTIRFSNWKPIGPLVLFRQVTINHADVRLELLFDSVSLEPSDADRFEPPNIQGTPANE